MTFGQFVKLFLKRDSKPLFVCGSSQKSIVTADYCVSVDSIVCGGSTNETNSYLRL